ncbi:MAG: hypothetical protein UT05_C0003G0014 [Parcubacteria group bacterium GW2011_GWF2_38_76]|nr:MAG: hypothetical protein UT05_C0003G0014 [Parcubacteria group bacterium GW2011_GWF2_38_76]HBM46212.1 hypothetical protein [Patescibacteria group bacterium]
MKRRDQDQFFTFDEVKNFEAPTCFHERKLWFDIKGYYMDRCKRVWLKLTEEEQERNKICAQISVVFVGKIIGENRCPTISDWAGFSIVNAISKVLTGKFCIPPKDRSLTEEEVENITWKLLWNITKTKKARKILDRKFIEAILRDFLPREQYCPPEHPYLRSRFSEKWKFAEYADTFMSSTGNIRIEAIEQAERTTEVLPPEIINSIDKIREHIPDALKISMEYIKARFKW